jgi:hypothetical protein
MNITITISDMDEMCETNKEQLKEVLPTATETCELPDYYSVERMAIEHRMTSALSTYNFNHRFSEPVKPNGTIIDYLA